MYQSLGATQHSLAEFVSALESENRTLDIRLKEFGEEHSETAPSFRDSKIIENALAAKGK